MKSVSFDRIHARVDELLIESDVCRSNSHSFLKIFQHGISYAMIDAKEKLIKRPWTSLPIEKLKAFIQSFIRPTKWTKPNNYSVVFFDGPRGVENNGKKTSFFFDKCGEVLGSRAILVSNNHSSDQWCTLSISSVHVVHKAWTPVEQALFSEIAEVRLKLEKAQHFTNDEKAYILSALRVFWEAFRKYYHYLKETSVRTVIFYPHYHNEGLIAACGALGIRTIELQHGLISSADLYYVYKEKYKPLIAEAFFPDMIYVQGDYWKRVLQQGVEFTPDRIKVVGDYSLKPIFSQPDLSKKRNLILIAAQKGMIDVYLWYSKMLQSRLQKEHPDWSLAVKIHPLDKEADRYYNELTPLHIEVIGKERSIEQLFEQAKIQISVYSTTFFDAVGYEVVNMALLEGDLGRDYAESMVKDGIAWGLTQMQDPVELFHSGVHSNAVLSRSDVYAPMDESFFRFQ